MLTKPRKTKKSSSSRAKKIVLGIIALGFIFGGGVLVWASTITMPDLSNFEARKIANSSKITDRTGTVVLYDIHQSVRRSEIPIDQMGDNIKNAVVDIEDVHFYEHSGIRISSILRAVLVNIFHAGFTQGGSTITQQIIKNTLLNTDKSFTRKFKEWVLAVKLEREFSKDQILQIYLNDAPLGGTIYGVEEASKAYFNKSAKDLSIPEAAYIAAMLPAPTYYSPYGSHKTSLDARKNLVLKKMRDAGYLSAGDYEWAKEQVVTFSAQVPNSIKAPHFVFYILDYLQQKYGEDVMENGGYTIKTTLDYDLQQKAEEIVKDRVLNPKDGTEKVFRASNQGLVALDPTTGQILAMVGSRDYFDKQIDGAYNIATANRQPGSSFKPFVYSTAFEKGYTPETILFDVPTEFSTNCTADQQPLPGHTDKDCYHPGNFDDKFKGPISLRSAIAESRNVPSVKLLYLVGVDAAVNTAHKLGITTLQNPKEIGLSLVLGGGEVKLLDMVSSYGVFANSGTKNETTGILEVRDHAGNIVEQYEKNETNVMDKNAVLQLNDVLSDPVARAPTFGSTITIPGVAVKTGTTNNDKDAWIVGYTPTFVAGVWSGNNDNRSMGSGGAAVSGPTWKLFMQYALQKYPATAFETPVPDPVYSSLKPVLRGQWMGNESIKIDKLTGLRATDATPAQSIEEKVVTSVHDILYWVNKNDPRGAPPTTPSSDPEFHLWNPPVESWWQQHASAYTIITPDQVPSGQTNDALHPAPSITISGLPETMKSTESAQVKITATDQYPLTTAVIYVDGIYISSLSSPFVFTILPTEYGLRSGLHQLRVDATNSVYGKTTLTKTFITQ